MIRVLTFNPGMSTSLTPADGLSLLDHEALVSGSVDEHLWAVDDRDRIRACCSLWHRDTPALDGCATGLIGHYQAVDPAAGETLLDEAVVRLEAAGVDLAIGPMDGNTWHRYRLITERGGRPAFFMEPDHPDDWPDHFQRVGFSPLAGYFSAEVNDLTVRQPKLIKLEERLLDSGVSIRCIDPDRFETELTRVHELSLRAFTNNFLYTPIDRESFLAMYGPIREKLVPELVLLAEQDGELLGYVFGVPDLLQPARGEKVDTAIVKTLAIRPGRRSAGLGGLLMERCHLAAHALGMKRAIHALMHESNKSLSLSSHYGQPFRRYTLFSKRVGA